MKRAIIRMSLIPIIFGLFLTFIGGNNAQAMANKPRRSIQILSVNSVKILEPDYVVLNWTGNVGTGSQLVQYLQDAPGLLTFSGNFTVQSIRNNSGKFKPVSHVLFIKSVVGELNHSGEVAQGWFSGKIRVNGTLDGIPFVVDGFSYIDPRTGGHSDIRLFKMPAPHPAHEVTSVMYQINLNVSEAR